MRSAPRTASSNENVPRRSRPRSTARRSDSATRGAAMCRVSIGGGVRSRPPSAWPSTAGGVGLPALLGGNQLVELLDLLARQHEPRLELEQRRDEDEELRRRLEVELVAGLEVVEVGEHDLAQLDLQQVELLAQDEREEQVERPREDVEVQLQAADQRRGHARRRVGARAADQRRLGRRTGPTPIAARTSASVAEAIARAFSAPAASVASRPSSSGRSSS